MPMVEVDELELQQSKKLRTTVEKILKNPKTRRGFMESVKTVEPETPIPELDATAPVEDKLSKLEKALEDEKKSRADSDAKREQDARLGKIASDQAAVEGELRRAGWTEEGIKGVKELAEKHGILDLSIAAAAFEKQHPPADPVTPTSRSGGWDFLQAPVENDPNAEFVKKLVETKGENEPLLNRRAQEALQEIRGQRR